MTYLPVMKSNGAPSSPRSVRDRSFASGHRDLVHYSDLNPVDVGERLRRARDAAAYHASRCRPRRSASFVRRSRPLRRGNDAFACWSCKSLRVLYGTSVNALVRDEAIHVDLAPRFRKLRGPRRCRYTGGGAALGRPRTRGGQAGEFARHPPRVRNYPPERPIARGDVREQAENDANELRQRLGLGLAPIADIVTLLEFELGVQLVYVRRLKGKISGLFAYDETLGPCILLNGNHRKGPADPDGGA